MKPNDKAYAAAIDKYADTCGIDFSGSFENRVKSIVDAAYAAQFQSEDYDWLIKRLREIDFKLRSTTANEATVAKDAADAIEALLAERDDFAEQIALRSENGISKDLQEFLRKFKEDDSAAIRMFAQYRDLEIEMDSWKSLWEKTNAHMRQVEAERDALAARLAPVEDEALVSMAADKMRECAELAFAPAAIVLAIRPHIEAAERERCAKIAERYIGYDVSYCHSDSVRSAGYVTACRAIAAAIRSGSGSVK